METHYQSEITVVTLSSWLEDGRPVEIIDIRPAADYAAWHIPGSRNIDAYDAVRAGHPGPLAAYRANRDTTVVAVCFSGRTSLEAIRYLRGRGIAARSLAGGMQAWGMAWNTAEVPLRAKGVRVIQVRRTGKGCLSYMIGSAHEALVIDPSLAPQVYHELAARHGWRITTVLDTHIHADHVSRARALAGMSEAIQLLPRQERSSYACRTYGHGDVIVVGTAQLEAVHTPGHTRESSSLLLGDEALFSGDTLFLGSVGRPDLEADKAELEARARALYYSLQRLAAGDPQSLVLPGHTSQPVRFDNRPLTAPLRAVVANLARFGEDETRFVRRIAEDIPPTPPNYRRIVQLNEAGLLPQSELAQLEAGANHCAVV